MPSKVHIPNAPTEPLTKREMEVLSLLDEGHSDKDIADTLITALSTAKHHVEHIIAKLGVGSRGEAVAFARKHSLISSDHIEDELSYDDISLLLETTRELKKGNNLTLGMTNAQRLVDNLDKLVKERSRIDLLEPYFEALFELCWYRLLVTPAIELEAATQPLLQSMRDIYTQTHSQQILGLLLLIRGDIRQTLSREHPNIAQRAYHDLQTADELVTNPDKRLETILRKNSRIVAEFGTKQDFNSIMSEYEDELDRYRPEGQHSVVGISLEGMSRAYITRFQRFGAPADADLAVKKLKESKEELKKGRLQGDTNGAFDLRSAKGTLLLSQLKIIDLDIHKKMALVTEINTRAANMGDRRLPSEVDDLLALVD